MPKAKLEGVLDVNNKPFVKGMNEATTHAKKKGKEMKGFFDGVGGKLGGMLGGAAIVATARAIGGFGGQVADMAASVGIGTEEFQRYSFAIEQSGGSQESFVRGMGALIAKSEEAKDGNERALMSFERLGISFEDLQKSTPDKLLLMVADALKRNGGDAATTAAAMDLLGSKVALKLIPALKDGSEEFLKVGDSATIMSDKTITSIDRMGDKLNEFKVGAMSKLANLFDPDLWKGVAARITGKSGISTPAITKDELQAAKLENDARRAPSLMTGPKGDRFGVRGLMKPGFNTSAQGATMTDADNFGSAFVKGRPVGMPRATMLDGAGQFSAHHAVRRGDAARRKAEEAERKKEKDPLLSKAAATAKNTAAIAKAFGVSGTEES